MKYNDNGQWKDINIKVSDTLPIGTVVPFAGERIPDGWLLCDGRAVSRTDYKELHNIIDDIYGEGDGTTTFNIPNMLGKTIVGYKQSDDDFNHLGYSAGVKEHNHSLSSGYVRMYIDGKTLRSYQSKTNNTLNNYAAVLTSGQSDGYQTLGSTALGGSTGNASNLQPYIVQFYIIKAKQSIGIVGKVVDVKSDSNENTYSCDYVNKQLEKNVMIAGLSANQTTTITGYEVVSINKIVMSIGDKLTLKNNNIEVGEGINYLKVSAQVFFSDVDMNGKRLEATIQKNTANVLYTERVGRGVYEAITTGTVIIPVVKGDKIRLCAGSYTSTGLKITSGDTRTFITVESF